MQAFRESGGRQRVWGKPPRKIEAQYETGDGRTKTSLLLASGQLAHLWMVPQLISAG